MLRIRLPRGIVLTLHPFSKLTAGEPRRALVFTYLFGGCFVLLGSLDVVAPLLSMCFLLCYASMNITVFVLSILEDPHWRPRWRYFHWSVGLAGFLLCCTLMFLINWYFALAAWAVALVILGLIVQAGAQTDWGSALHGLRFQIATRSLLAIDMEQYLLASWQPQMLLLYQLREETSVDTTGDGLDDTAFNADPDACVHLDGGEVARGLGGLRFIQEAGVSRTQSREGPPSPKGPGPPSPKGSDTSPKRDTSPKPRRAGSASKLGGGGMGGTSAPVGGKPLDRSGSTGSSSGSSQGAVRAKAPLLVKDGDQGGHTHELMLSVADQLRHGSGLIIAAAIIPLAPGQDYDDQEAVLKSEAEKTLMSRLMKTMGVQGFCMTVLAREVSEGRSHAIQCAGLGPLTPNTILMGWPWWWKAKPTRFVPEFMSVVQQATLRRKALLCCHNVGDFPTNDELQTGSIDVWWIKHDGGLLLLMAHLLRKHRVWKRCALRLHLITETGTDRTLLRERVLTLLQRINIDATVEEVLEVEPSSLMPYMQEEKTKGWQQRHADEQDDQQVRTSMRVHSVPANALSSTTALLDDRHHVLHTSTPGARATTHGHGHGPDSGSMTRGRGALGRSRATSKEGVERRPSKEFSATGRKSPGGYWQSPAAAPVMSPPVPGKSGDATSMPLPVVSSRGR